MLFVFASECFFVYLRDCCCARDACYHVTNDPDHASRVEVSLDPCPYIRSPHTSARVVLLLGRDMEDKSRRMGSTHHRSYLSSCNVGLALRNGQEV